MRDMREGINKAIESQEEDSRMHGGTELTERDKAMIEHGYIQCALQIGTDIGMKNESYKAHQEATELLKWNDILAKAKEVQESEVTTMLYCKENDEYYGTVEEFADTWKENYKGEDIPERLWVTTDSNLYLDAYSILENACDTLHEDALENCNVSDLQAILDKYVAQQSGTTTYYPCYDEYVLIKK